MRKMIVHIIGISVTTFLVATTATAQDDPTAHIGVEGNWNVIWNGVADPDSATAAFVSLYRERTVTCDEGRMNGCVFELSVPAQFEWSSNFSANTEGPHFMQSIDVGAGNATADLRLPYFVLGRWGGEETITQIDDDALHGNWSYLYASGQAEWTRIVPSYTSLEIIDNTHPSALISYRSDLANGIELNLDANTSNWLDTQNFPSQRPSLDFIFKGDNLQGVHFAALQNAVGIEVGYAYSETNQAGLGHVSFSLTFWPGAVSGDYKLLVDGQSFDLKVNITEKPEEIPDLTLRTDIYDRDELRPIDTFNPDAEESLELFSGWGFIIEEKQGAVKPAEFRLNVTHTDAYIEFENTPTECETFSLDPNFAFSCEGRWTGPSRRYSGDLAGTLIEPVTQLNRHHATLNGILQGRASGGIWLELDRAKWTREFANCTTSYFHATEPLRAVIQSPDNPLSWQEESFNWLERVDAIPGKRLFPYEQSEYFEGNVGFYRIDDDGEVDIEALESSQYDYLRTLADELISNKLDLREVDARLTDATNYFIASEMYFIEPFQTCSSAPYDDMMSKRLLGLEQLAQLRSEYETSYEQSRDLMVAWASIVVRKLHYYDGHSGTVGPSTPVTTAIANEVVTHNIQRVARFIKGGWAASSAAATGWFALAMEGVSITTATMDLIELEDVSKAVNEANAWQENTEYFRLAAKRLLEFETELRNLTDQMQSAYNDNCICAN